MFEKDDWPNGSERLLFLTSFTAKVQLVFILTQENAFS